ncbi:MAG: hypothetical protein KGJ62_15720 [Armatimonadetes bacterium]|nr:hypothetical protein [Armatimonadota bacterium]MDE2208046.1 hypothetical protein [Armatimonadota bacterium]
MQASDGNLYGTCSNGGAYSLGTLYQITPQGTFVPIYAFTGGGGDGATPEAAPYEANNSLLYGTCTFGGSGNSGVVYRTDFNATHYVALLYADSIDGGMYPKGTLVQALDGNLYGTCENGGYPGTGGGTAFETNLAGSGNWLDQFYAPSGPQAAMLQLPNRSFAYTLSGETGINLNTGGTATGQIRDETYNPFANPWAYTFTGGADGQDPKCTLLHASDGFLYGTCVFGGAFPAELGFGTVWRIALDGSHFQVVYTFTGGSADGAYPEAGLIQASDGDLYGTCNEGGANNTGTVYKIIPGAPLGSNFVLVHSFAALNSTGDNSDGAYPYCQLVQASDGSIWGTCTNGGSGAAGTIWTYKAIGGPPAITGITPQESAVDWAIPDTITIAGGTFTSDAIAKFNGAALQTTYVDSGHITTTIPTALLTIPGNYPITVTQASGSSAPAPFTVVAPGSAISFAVGTMTRNADGSINVPITLTNFGNSPAHYVSLTWAYLGNTNTLTKLPINTGSYIVPGAHYSLTLRFPASAGAAGQTEPVYLGLSDFLEPLNAVVLP